MKTKVTSSTPDKLDDLDRRIIELLQRDSRLSFRKIAKKLEVAVGTVYKHIKDLEEEGVLQNYTVILDPVRLGYPLTVVMSLQAEGRHLVNLETKIAEPPNVIAVYDVTGDFDVVVIARFKDRSELNQFIKTLIASPHVKRTVTSLVLNVVKEDFRVKIS